MFVEEGTEGAAAAVEEGGKANMESIPERVSEADEEKQHRRKVVVVQASATQDKSEEEEREAVVQHIPQSPQTAEEGGGMAGPAEDTESASASSSSQTEEMQIEVQMEVAEREAGESASSSAPPAGSDSASSQSASTPVEGAGGNSDEQAERIHNPLPAAAGDGEVVEADGRQDGGQPLSEYQSFLPQAPLERASSSSSTVDTNNNAEQPLSESKLTPRPQSPKGGGEGATPAPKPCEEETRTLVA